MRGALRRAETVLSEGHPRVFVITAMTHRRIAPRGGAEPVGGDQEIVRAGVEAPGEDIVLPHGHEHRHNPRRHREHGANPRDLSRNATERPDRGAQELLRAACFDARGAERITVTRSRRRVLAGSEHQGHLSVAKVGGRASVEEDSWKALDEVRGRRLALNLTPPSSPKTP